MSVSKEEHLKLYASAVRRLSQIEIASWLSADSPKSKPHAKQKEVLDDIWKIQLRYVVAGTRAGKSVLPAREIAWICNRQWEQLPEGRPNSWGEGPFFILVAAQSLSHGQSELWNKKLKPLMKDEWKEFKQGTVIKSVKNKVTGDEILFVTHIDGSDRNRKLIQGYTANYVWCDEMPPNHEILEELQARCAGSIQGRFIATFTPKVVNAKIKQIVDSAIDPVAKKYKMSRFDNPMFAGQESIERAKLEGHSKSYINTVLYGDWSIGDNAVFSLEFESHIQDPPETYHPSWRHVESIDPALSSKMGQTLWAEDPETKIWYCVRARYIDDAYEPTRAVKLAEIKGYNIVKRVSDQAPWFINHANSKAFELSPRYTPVLEKTIPGKKFMLIKQTQELLGQGRIKIATWCDELIDEFMTCRWSDTAVDKIVNEQSFHLLDTVRYFVDNIPKPDALKGHTSWMSWLVAANEQRLEKQAKQAYHSSIWRKRRRR